MNPLLVDILTSNWLLHSENNDAYGVIVVSMLKGDQFRNEDYSEARTKNRPFAVLGSDGISDSRQPMNSPDLSRGSIAVIPINGVIMKEDAMCGPRGTVSIAADIKSADANPNIKSILLIVDSPGGTTSYTDVLAETVKNCEKPIVAYIQGTAASAAYWIVSGASKIISSSSLNMVGSIGTMLSYVDMKPYLESHGAVIHEVYASLSTEKNKHLADVRAGKYDSVKKDVLDVINKKFLAHVTANRPNLDPAALTGRIYLAEEAISAGLVDEIGSIEFALQIADNFPHPSNIQKPLEMKSIKMLAVWTALASFFGFSENIESKEITEEMVGRVNDELANLSNANAELTNQSAEKDLLIGQLQEQIAAETLAKNGLQSALTETQTAFDAFKASDAAEQIRSGKSADKSAETIASDQYLHNIIADQNS